MDGRSTYWLDIRNYRRRISRTSVLFDYQEKRTKRKGKRKKEKGKKGKRKKKKGKRKKEKRGNEIDSIGALNNMDEEIQSLSLIALASPLHDD